MCVLPMVGNLYSSAGTAAWLFDKVKYKENKAGLCSLSPEPGYSRITVANVSTSCHTIGITNVVARALLTFIPNDIRC
jgi:hypothetical protein